MIRYGELLYSGPLEALVARAGECIEAAPELPGDLGRLTEPQERDLIRTLSRYPEVVESAALNEEPHLLTHYLRELANDFHTYYNAHQFLVADADLRDARLKLILGVRQVLRNGLNLLGVSAPESM